MSKNERGVTYYAKPLIESLLKLGHSINLQDILSREVKNDEFEKLMVEIVNFSSFDEISFYTNLKGELEKFRFLKKSFLKTGQIKLEIIEEVTEESNLNLYNLIEGKTIKTPFGYEISQIPVPGIGEDFALELVEGIYLTRDNYGEAEDISPYTEIIEVISMALKQIIEQKNLIDELLRDELTNLYNRKCWNRECIEEGHLIAIDIDNFKSVNDTYGHDVGDVVLKKISETINQEIRIEDKAFRLGGEEFCIYVKELDIKVVLMVADRIRNKVKECLFKANPLNNIECEEITEFSRTISMGISEIVKGDKIEALIEADKRLYKAKTTGKNKIVID